MSAVFHDHQDQANPQNGRVIAPEEAVQLLRALHSRQPFFCSFEGQGGTLLVGVGTKLGCVQFTGPSGQPPFLMARGHGESDHVLVDFLSGGTPSSIPDRFLLPWREVEDIVARFVEGGTAPAGVTWEEI